jgi:hypothetical protein
MGTFLRRVEPSGSRNHTRELIPTTVYQTALLAAYIALGGCAVAPHSEVETVEVDAKKISLEHSSFSAHLASDAGNVNQTFAASLDPQVTTPTLTRLESSFTTSLGDSEERLQVGDAVSSVGMWGSSVRFGGMQFGTRSETRADVVTSGELATSGLAVLPTVADALFASIGATEQSLAAGNLSVKRSLRSLGGNGLGLTAKDALRWLRQSATRLRDHQQRVRSHVREHDGGLRRPAWLHCRRPW